MSGYVKNVNDAMTICVYHSDAVFNSKYLKTNIKSHDNKITITFHGKVPNEGRKCICLSAIVTDSIFKSNKKLLSTEKQVKTLREFNIYVTFREKFTIAKNYLKKINIMFT